jgi:Tol biopolymer transport system component
MTVKVGSVTATAPIGTVTTVDNDHYGTEPVGGIERVSVANDGTEASFWNPVACRYPLGSGVSATSRDGRFVTFWSAATNLVPADGNGAGDMFLRDRLNNTTERIDGDYDGSELSAGSEPYAPISDDGRYVAFSTSSPEVQPSGVTFSAFRRDRVTGTNEMVSISPTGVPVSGIVSGMTGDGRYVAFAASGAYYVRDVVAGTTQFVTAGTGSWNRTPLSNDGQQIAFVSSNSTLVANDTNDYPDVFVKNLETGAVERVNVTTSGQQDSTPPWSGAQPLNASRPVMSPDGRYVAFWSGSANLVTSGTTGVFLHDRATGVTEQESVGVVTSMTNCFAQDESVSDDGRYVSFSYHCEQNDTMSRTSDVNGAFLHDRSNNATVRVDKLPSGTPANSDGWSISPTSVMSGDGRYVVFQSDATNLVLNDTNDRPDVFTKRVN